jgi:hypothetical protein
MEHLRDLRRPGAKLAGLLVLAFGGVQIAKEYQWPHVSTWKQGSEGQLAYVILAILTAIATLLVIYGYHRMLARRESRDAFATAAQSFLSVAQKGTSIPHDQIRVNIWLVKGPWGFRRLVRAATAAPLPHRGETHITWTKGKGIIGQAWDRKKSRFADLHTVRSIYPTEARWCELKRDDRFRLSWDEFSQTSRYDAVLAVPMRRNRYARHAVRGVVAIDVLTLESRTDIDGIQLTDDFSSIISICEAAFNHRDD